MSRVLLPRTLDELWELWRGHPDLALFAGGTDLLVRRRRGLLDPPVLLCLERVGELAVVEEHEAGLFLGALATLQELLEHPLVRDRLPVLTQALAVLGSPPIRHMGTLGGNLVTASPAGDTLPPLYALGAEVELRSAGGNRRLPVEEFILGPGRTALGPGEILAGVWIRPPDGPVRQHYEKVSLRKALAIAVVSLAAVIELNSLGRVGRARLAWGSLGPTVVRSPRAEEALLGGSLRPSELRAAAEIIREEASPIDDLRATAAYRREVAGNLLLRLARPGAG